MANQCVTEFTIIGSEEVIRETLLLMIENLKANGVAGEEPPAEGATMQELAQWASGYTGEPSCYYLEALSAKGSFSTRPMGWDAQVQIQPYGELFTLRMDFDTAWGPADPEVESFIETLPSPCGVYHNWSVDGDGWRDAWLRVDGHNEHTELSTDFERFEQWRGEIDVFYAQMYKAITNRLQSVWAKG